MISSCASRNCSVIAAQPTQHRALGVRREMRTTTACYCLGPGRTAVRSCQNGAPVGRELGETGVGGGDTSCEDCGRLTPHTEGQEWCRERSPRRIAITAIQSRCAPQQVAVGPVQMAFACTSGPGMTRCRSWVSRGGLGGSAPLPPRRRPCHGTPSPAPGRGSRPRMRLPGTCPPRRDSRSVRLRFRSSPVRASFPGRALGGDHGGLRTPATRVRIAGDHAAGQRWWD